MPGPAQGPRAPFATHSGGRIHLITHEEELPLLLAELPHPTTREVLPQLIKLGPAFGQEEKHRLTGRSHEIWLPTQWRHHVHSLYLRRQIRDRSILEVHARRAEEIGPILRSKSVEILPDAVPYLSVGSSEDLGRRVGPKIETGTDKR